MKRIPLLASLFLSCLLLFTPVSHSQSPFDGCKAEGLGKKTRNNPAGNLPDRFKELNRLKNRDTAPRARDIDESITLTEILKPENDGEFENSQGAEITGYVAYVYWGEKRESVNCSREDLRDIHIAIVCHPKYREDKSQWMFAEITPRFQDRLGDNDSLQYLETKWVRLRGWMFYDAQHKGNARTVNPRGKAIWRATPWEIHPLTSFAVLDGAPRGDLCP